MAVILLATVGYLKVTVAPFKVTERREFVLASHCAPNGYRQSPASSSCVWLTRKSASTSRPVGSTGWWERLRASRTSYGACGSSTSQTAVRFQQAAASQATPMLNGLHHEYRLERR